MYFKDFLVRLKLHDAVSFELPFRDDASDAEHSTKNEPAAAVRVGAAGINLAEETKKRQQKIEQYVRIFC